MLLLLLFVFLAGGSRSGSRQGSRSASRSSLQPNANVPAPKESSQSGSGRSWMLEHVTEVVYLATQIQITEQMEACMKSVADGNKDAMQVRYAM